MKVNFWGDRSVLVTGCTGFLGAWLCEELISKGARVAGFARDWFPESRFITEALGQKAVEIRGEVENLNLLEETIRQYEIETVFHLAAQAIVETGTQDPLATLETNVRGTWNLLEACRSAGSVKRIVVASSDKAYGAQAKLPYDEKTPLEGSHPYDASKSCADLISRSYYLTYQVPVCVTRCGNFYGGGDLNFSRIVPGTIRSVLLGERPIIRSDGTYVRDYFYIKDVVLAYLCLAEQMDREEILGEAFNFGSETKTTVLELTHLILKLMGREDLKPVVLDQTRQEIRTQYLSSAKARRILGWQPKYELQAGLKETIDWYKDFFSKSGKISPARLADSFQ